VFGIIRPCRNRLGDELRDAWLAHLCGTCLALRDAHGHLARLVTNYDAVVISALVEAQLGGSGRRRVAGPCALRGLRGASVAVGPAAQLAAAVSLVLASAKVSDHLADGDVSGAVRRRAARRLATRWGDDGFTSASSLGLDGRALLSTVADQTSIESMARSLLEVTAPTEGATALAFRQTAIVAGRPENAKALAEVGRLFGRLAHLLDAVEDLRDDAVAGRWNPVQAFDVDAAEVRRLCDDAVLGVRLALGDADFVDGRLVHALLVHELPAAVTRTFGTAGQPTPPPLTPPLPPEQQPPEQQPPEQQPPGQPPPVGWGAIPESKRKGVVAGCLGWLVVCGTCQACCADEFTDPCTGQRRQGACRDCGDCWCPDCGDCCDCGDGCCCDGCDCDCGC
jgi:hypothetical protein